MDHDQDNQEPNAEHQYPEDPSSYIILEKIGVGSSSEIYKATCTSASSTSENSTTVVVAVKTIKTVRDDSTDIVEVEEGTSTVSHDDNFSHHNLLQPHCSFIVTDNQLLEQEQRQLWVVMPYMSGGSLGSIISSSFRSELPEPFIAVVLKQVLQVLSYLHNETRTSHGNLRLTNILVDISNGHVKLSGFRPPWHPPSKVIALTPYWAAPELEPGYHGTIASTDIWSFGVTALELAYGRPPLTCIGTLCSLFLTKIMKERFGFTGLDTMNRSRREFSDSFKEMVTSCLVQDPKMRPTAEMLLEHPFFKNCEALDFLVENFLHGLPSINERFEESDFGDEDLEKPVLGGWIFNPDWFEFDPVFVTASDFDQHHDSGSDQQSIEGIEPVASGSSSLNQVEQPGLDVLSDGGNVGEDHTTETEEVSESSMSGTSSSGQDEELDSDDDQDEGGGGGGGGDGTIEMVEAVDPSELSSGSPMSDEEPNSGNRSDQGNEAGVLSGDERVELLVQLTRRVLFREPTENRSDQGIGARGLTRSERRDIFLLMVREIIDGEPTERCVLSLFMSRKARLDATRKRIMHYMSILGGQVTTDEQLKLDVEAMEIELENQIRKGFRLEIEIILMKSVLAAKCRGR